MSISEEKKEIRSEIRRRRLQLDDEFLNEVDKELPQAVFSIDDEDFRLILKSSKLSEIMIKVCII